MTNEEFHGMMMAALHGPHAEEIVDRIILVAAPTLAKVIADGSDDLRATVFELCVLSHLDRIRSSGDVGMAMRVAAVKVATGDMIRARVRKAIRGLPNADEHAAKIFLDLPAVEMETDQ